MIKRDSTSMDATGNPSYIFMLGEISRDLKNIREQFDVMQENSKVLHKDYDERIKALEEVLEFVRFVRRYILVPVLGGGTIFIHFVFTSILEPLIQNIGLK